MGLRNEIRNILLSGKHKMFNKVQRNGIGIVPSLVSHDL